MLEDERFSAVGGRSGGESVEAFPNTIPNNCSSKAFCNVSNVVGSFLHETRTYAYMYV